MSPQKKLQTFPAVIITGGSSGIGKSFMEHVGKMHPGAVVFNLSRRIPSINVPGLKWHHWSCDLANRAQTEKICESLSEALNREVPTGRILVINNSGFGTYGPFPEPNLDRQLEMLEVNVCAPIQLVARLLPLLRARGGAILNIASTAAFQPTGYLAAYGASKAFILHWSLALGEELRGSGVQVLAVCPGPTATQFFRNAGLSQSVVPDAIGQTADEVVVTALHALARGRTMVVSGWKNRLLAAISSRLPKPLAARLAARVIARYRGTGGTQPA